MGASKIGVAVTSTTGASEAFSICVSDEVAFNDGDAKAGASSCVETIHAAAREGSSNAVANNILAHCFALHLHAVGWRRADSTDEQACTDACAA